MKKLLLALVIVLCLALAAHAAWQLTKTTYAVGVIASPSGDGTFRLLSAYCDEVRLGDQGFCSVFIENLSSDSIHVDDWEVVSLTPGVIVDDVDIFLSRDIAYGKRGCLDIHFHVLETASPGGFTLQVSVTCSGPAQPTPTSTCTPTPTPTSTPTSTPTPTEAPRVSSVLLWAQPPSAPAGGTVAVWVRIRDQFGNPMPNQTVGFTTEGPGFVNPSTRQTDGAGEAQTALTSTGAGLVRVTATADGISDFVEVQFTG